MRRFLLLLAVVACGGDAELPAPATAFDDAGAILPDTATVDGVLEHRHGADAFARAPAWTIDSTPLVTIDGGEQFDLTYVIRVHPHPSGAFLALRRVNIAELMVFDSTGLPSHVLARPGEGPGELVNPGEPMLLGDTIVLADGGNTAVNWYDTERVIRTAPLREFIDPGCWSHFGTTADRRRVSIFGCFGLSPDDTMRRRPNPVALVTPDYSRIDTVLTIPGMEMVLFEIRSGSRTMSYPTPLRLGLRPVASGWGDGFVVGNGTAPRVLSRYGLDGTLRARLVPDLPRRAVTDEMRQAVIDVDLAVIDGPGEAYTNIEEARRRAREMPFTDSLPPYQVLLEGPGGTLWAVDGQSPVDSAWSATVFRSDGAILARVTGPRAGVPVGMRGGDVIVREVDEDGVVRFGIFAVRGG